LPRFPSLRPRCCSGSACWAWLAGEGSKPPRPRPDPETYASPIAGSRNGPEGARGARGGGIRQRLTRKDAAGAASRADCGGPERKRDDACCTRRGSLGRRYRLFVVREKPAADEWCDVERAAAGMRSPPESRERGWTRRCRAAVTGARSAA
jgi:hypothetical protein